MAGKHSALLRGISAVKSPLFQGRFGRMFRNLPPAQFGASDDESDKNLTKLGAAMVSAPDTPKDGKDDEESGIPALYTYFGQFIDHDITFDPSSSLMRQNDPDALVDFRTPRLDLDSLYGRGPDDLPYMYDGNKFRLGRPLFSNDVATSAQDPGGRQSGGHEENHRTAAVASRPLQRRVHFSRSSIARARRRRTAWLPGASKLVVSTSATVRSRTNSMMFT